MSLEFPVNEIENAIDNAISNWIRRMDGYMRNGYVPVDTGVLLADLRLSLRESKGGLNFVAKFDSGLDYATYQNEKTGYFDTLVHFGNHALKQELEYYLNGVKGIRVIVTL